MSGIKTFSSGYLTSMIPVQTNCTPIQPPHPFAFKKKYKPSQVFNVHKTSNSLSPPSACSQQTLQYMKPKYFQDCCVYVSVRDYCHKVLFFTSLLSFQSLSDTQLKISPSLVIKATFKTYKSGPNPNFIGSTFNLGNFSHYFCNVTYSISEIDLNRSLIFMRFTCLCS